MSDEQPVWVSADAAMAANNSMVAVFGGTFGLRSGEDLRDALADPREVWRDTDLDFAAIAAAYIMAFVTRKPFRSTNEHTAWAVMETFVVLNGRSMRADFSKAWQTIRDAESGKIDYSAVAAWVRRHIGGAG